MKISEIKMDARETLNGNWSKGLILGLFMFFIIQVVTTLFEYGVSGKWFTGSLPWYVEPVELVYAVLLTPFTAGITWFYIDLSRKKDIRITDPFHLYQNTALSLKIVWTSIVVGFFSFLWTLLLVVPGIYKSLAYSQALYVLHDHPEYSATEAITESRRLMQHHKWAYVLLALSFIVWFLLILVGLIGLGILLSIMNLPSMVNFGMIVLLGWFGFIWISPYFYTALSGFYNVLTEWDEAEY